MFSTSLIPHLLPQRCSGAKYIFSPLHFQKSSHDRCLPLFLSPHRPSPTRPSEWGLGGPAVLVQDSGGTSAQLLISLPSQMDLENISVIAYLTSIDTLTSFNLIQKSALAFLLVFSKAEGNFWIGKRQSWIVSNSHKQDLKRALCSVIAYSNMGWTQDGQDLQ